MPPDETRPGYIDRLLDWLLQQGVSTVLLCLIALGAWKGIPAGIDKLDLTFRAQQEAHRSERDEWKTEIVKQWAIVEKLAAEQRRVAAPPAGAAAPAANREQQAAHLVEPGAPGTH